MATIPLLACLVLGVFVALPSLAALLGRRRSRECSEFAQALAEFAATVRRERRCLAIDESLLARARRLGVPELMSFEYLRELAQPEPALLAEAAQRLALRLKRRVAFARKMLARTASGRRRAALAAAAPAIFMLLLGVMRVVLPPAALTVLVLLEALGCWLLWYLARVEV
jgi:Flp pilus assembly protein TadB